MSHYRVLLSRYQPTSRAAWLSMADQLGAIDGQILRYILRRDGATCAEVEDALNLSHQTASAQIAHLSRAGILTDSRATRKNAKGRSCIVWTVMESDARMPLFAGAA